MIGFLMRLFHVRRRKQHNFGESIEASFVICVTLKKPEIDKKKKINSNNNNNNKVIDSFLFHESQT